MSENQPKMFYTRSMAFCAFFYSLWYIQTSPTIDHAVLVFLGSVIAFWALGRASFSELLQVFKEWLSKR